MPHTTNPSVFRLGKSLNWNLISSPLYFSKNFRFKIVLNSFLLNFLYTYKYRLVKYAYQTELHGLKIFIVALKTSFLASTKISPLSKINKIVKYKNKQVYGSNAFILEQKIKEIISGHFRVFNTSVYRHKAKKPIFVNSFYSNPLKVFDQAESLVFFYNKALKTRFGNILSLKKNYIFFYKSLLRFLNNNYSSFSRFGNKKKLLSFRSFLVKHYLSINRSNNFPKKISKKLPFTSFLKVFLQARLKYIKSVLKTSFFQISFLKSQKKSLFTLFSKIVNCWKISNKKIVGFKNLMHSIFLKSSYIASSTIKKIVGFKNFFKTSKKIGYFFFWNLLSRINKIEKKASLARNNIFSFEINSFLKEINIGSLKYSFLILFLNSIFVSSIDFIHNFNFTKKLKFIHFKKNNFSFKIFINFFFNNMVILKFFKIKHITCERWLNFKSLSFIIEKDLEKLFKINISLKIIDPFNKMMSSFKEIWQLYVKKNMELVDSMFFSVRESKYFQLFALYFIISLKYRSSAVLGEYISSQFLWRKKKRHVSFMKFIYYFIKSVHKVPSFLSGSYVYFNLGIYGKINGNLRSRRYFIRAAKRSSNLPVRTISLLTDYSLTYAESPFGTYGIRIWSGYY